MVIGRKKGKCKDTRVSEILCYFGNPRCHQRDKQKANFNLYLSLCFCQHNEKAKEQHSLSKHGLEPFTGKGLMQESE